MPGEAYAKGFLRMYAEFLGLDGGLYVDEYNERVAAHQEERLVPDSLAPSKGRSRRSPPARSSASSRSRSSSPR